MGLLFEPDARPVEPLEGAGVVIARRHVAEADVSTQAILLVVVVKNHGVGRNRIYHILIRDIPNHVKLEIQILDLDCIDGRQAYT